MPDNYFGAPFPAGFSLWLCDSVADFSLSVGAEALLTPGADKIVGATEEPDGTRPNGAAFSGLRIARQERHTATPGLIFSPHAGQSSCGFGSYSHGLSSLSSRAARRSRSVMNIGLFERSHSRSAEATSLR